MTTIQKIWKCPTCSKEFAKTNQSHKCEIVEVEFLFRDKDNDLFGVYKNLLHQLKTKGGRKVTTSKKAITIYTDSRKAFLGIEPKKKFLDIWFLLGRKEDVFPVFKILQPSKNKFGHFVRLYDKKDIDSVLIKWIEESYDLVR